MDPSFSQSPLNSYHIQGQRLPERLHGTSGHTGSSILDPQSQWLNQPINHSPLPNAMINRRMSQAATLETTNLFQKPFHSSASFLVQNSESTINSPFQAVGVRQNQRRFSEMATSSTTTASKHHNPVVKAELQYSSPFEDNNFQKLSQSMSSSNQSAYKEEEEEMTSSRREEKSLRKQQAKINYVQQMFDGRGMNVDYSSPCFKPSPFNLKTSQSTPPVSSLFLSPQVEPISPSIACSKFNLLSISPSEPATLEMFSNFINEQSKKQIQTQHQEKKRKFQHRGEQINEQSNNQPSSKIRKRQGEIILQTNQNQLSLPIRDFFDQADESKQITLKPFPDSFNIQLINQLFYQLPSPFLQDEFQTKKAVTIKSPEARIFERRPFPSMQNSPQTPCFSDHSPASSKLTVPSAILNTISLPPSLPQLPKQGQQFGGCYYTQHVKPNLLRELQDDNEEDQELNSSNEYFGIIGHPQFTLSTINESSLNQSFPFQASENNLECQSPLDGNQFNHSANSLFRSASRSLSPQPQREKQQYVYQSHQQTSNFGSNLGHNSHQQTSNFGSNLGHNSHQSLKSNYLEQIQQEISKQSTSPMFLSQNDHIQINQVDTKIFEIIGPIIPENQISSSLAKPENFIDQYLHN